MKLDHIEVFVLDIDGAAVWYDRVFGLKVVRRWDPAPVMIGAGDANHAQQGMYLFAHPSLESRGRVDGPTLYDVAPTVLTQLGMPVPRDMRGEVLH